jgi:hypothetical protein
VEIDGLEGIAVKASVFRSCSKQCVAISRQRYREWDCLAPIGAKRLDEFTSVQPR